MNRPAFLLLWQNNNTRSDDHHYRKSEKKNWCMWEGRREYNSDIHGHLKYIVMWCDAFELLCSNLVNMFFFSHSLHTKKKLLLMGNCRQALLLKTAYRNNFFFSSLFSSLCVWLAGVPNWKCNFFNLVCYSFRVLF